MNILYLLPGPSYNISSVPFQIKYKLLSKNLTGYIFTTSGATEIVAFDNFVCYAIKHENGNMFHVKFAMFCISKILKFKKENVNIDLIVAYDPIKTGLIGLILKVLLKSKFIVEVNGVYNSPYVWEDDENIKGSILKKMIFPSIIRFVLNSSDGIKLLFQNQIDNYNIILKNKKTATYFNLVNTELFKCIENKNEILLVGFPFKIKGVDILIRAFKLIADKFPDWRLKILGWYPDMKELNAEINGHPQIFHHPPIAASQMPEHIGRCGFFVLPSRTEAMGRVLVEAMAAGKARIGTRVDGIPTVINDGVDGLLVEPENVEDLAAKMEMLIIDPELRQKLGDAAKVRVKREFTPEQYLKATLDFYSQVVS